MYILDINFILEKQKIQLK